MKTKYNQTHVQPGFKGQPKYSRADSVNNPQKCKVIRTRDLPARNYLDHQLGILAAWCLKRLAAPSTSTWKHAIERGQGRAYLFLRFVLRYVAPYVAGTQIPEHRVRSNERLRTTFNIGKICRDVVLVIKVAPSGKTYRYDIVDATRRIILEFQCNHFGTLARSLSTWPRPSPCLIPS